MLSHLVLHYPNTLPGETALRGLLAERAVDTGAHRD